MVHFMTKGCIVALCVAQLGRDVDVELLVQGHQVALSLQVVGQPNQLLDWMISLSLGASGQPGVTGLERGHRDSDLLFKSFLKGVNRYQVATKEGQQSARCGGCYPQRQAFKIEAKQEKDKQFKK